MPPDPAPALSSSTAAVWIDLTDIFSWYVVNPYPTGIRQFIEACLRSEAFRSDPRLRYCYVQSRWKMLEVPRSLVNRFLSVNAEEFGEALQEIRSRYVDAPVTDDKSPPPEKTARTSWKDRIFGGDTAPAKQADSPPERCRPGDGDCFIVLGAFWGRCAVDLILPKIKKKRVKVVAMIHDISPLTHPHFHPVEVVQQFAESVPHLLQHSDMIIAPSEHTLKMVSHHLAAEMPGSSESKWPALRRIVMPECFTSRIPTKADDKPSTEAVAFLASAGEFVLIVSTLEPRKNHLCAIKAWAQLYLELGEACPVLVLIGKQGWHNEFTMAKLRELNYLNGKIVHFAGVPSDVVAQFYDRCLFTLFPSFDEGFGLPVTESLARGKRCLAADIPVLRETGKNAATYFNPYDHADLAAKVLHLLEESRAEPAAPPIITPHTHDECGRSIIERIDQCLDSCR